MSETVIRANCDVCGEVELSQDDIILVRRPGRDRSDGYAFVCCDGVQVRPANKKVVAVLLVAGTQSVVSF